MLTVLWGAAVCTGIYIVGKHVNDGLKWIVDKAFDYVFRPPSDSDPDSGSES